MYIEISKLIDVKDWVVEIDRSSYTPFFIRAKNKNDFTVGTLALSYGEAESLLAKLAFSLQDFDIYKEEVWTGKVL